MDVVLTSYDKKTIHREEANALLASNKPKAKTILRKKKKFEAKVLTSAALTVESKNEDVIFIYFNGHSLKQHNGFVQHTLSDSYIQVKNAVS